MWVSRRSDLVCTASRYFPAEQGKCFSSGMTRGQQPKQLVTSRDCDDERSNLSRGQRLAAGTRTVNDFGSSVAPPPIGYQKRNSSKKSNTARSRSANPDSSSGRCPVPRSRTDLVSAGNRAQNRCENSGGTQPSSSGQASSSGGPE